MINKIERLFKSKKKKKKKKKPDKSDLFIAESHESVNRASAVLEEYSLRKPD